MSRLEEAMEKARQLRHQETPPVKPIEKVKNTEELSLPHVAENIEISSPRLVAANNYNLPIAEEYRKLKSIIVQLTNRERFMNTLLVTSSVGGEGKSVTSLNLALSLAQEYDHSVLLVDADLRNRSICRYLGLKPQVGLADCLLDDLHPDKALIDTGLGNLILLPAGKTVINPVELLSSQKMKNLFATLKRRFAESYIIFDTSPVLPFADARIIGTMVDGIVFVVKEGGPSLKNVSAALESLKEMPVLGLVYNKATSAGLSGGYHYYYYDYDNKPRSLNPPTPEANAGIWSRIFKPRA